jgi:hypothetical protein
MRRPLRWNEADARRRLMKSSLLIQKTPQDRVMLVFQALQPLMLAVVAVFAGGCVVVQQAFNASLRADLGSAFWAAFVSYAGGALTLAVVMVALREPWIVPALTKPVRA